tara:strand:+ start:1162 stop:1572 length:411 start_codon:yes stop_codon:yes gene_type:complete
MKKVSYVLLGFSFLILVFSLTGFVLREKPIQRDLLYASVNVSDRLGFDVNGTALTFGEVIVRGSSVRNVIYNNNYDFPILAKISVEGDIGQMLDFEETVRIESGEEKKIPFFVSTGDYEMGYYSGDVEFEIIPLSN